MKSELLKKSSKIVFIFVIFIFGLGYISHILSMRENKGIHFYEMIPTLTTGIIQSGSMSPVLEKGDLVYIKQEKTYRPGDIVLVTDEKGRQVIHRLVIYNTYANIILTKGDANDGFDEPLSCNAIIGKLCFSIPKIGKLLSLFEFDSIKRFFFDSELIWACYRSDFSESFSMEVSPIEENNSHFSIDEIDVWLTK